MQVRSSNMVVVLIRHRFRRSGTTVLHCLLFFCALSTTAPRVMPNFRSLARETLKPSFTRYIFLKFDAKAGGIPSVARETSAMSSHDRLAAVLRNPIRRVPRDPVETRAENSQISLDPE